MRALVVSAAVGLLSACPLTEGPAPERLTSFEVAVSGVYTIVGNTRTPLAVVAPCVAKYGSEAAVPQEVRGTKACRYVIPPGEVRFDITAQAKDFAGAPITDFNGSVSFRVIPGDLPTEMLARWAQMENGTLSTSVRALHPYAAVRVWVEDAPPKPLFDGGVKITEGAPPPAARTFASGASPVVYFADQTIQSLQLLGDFDNRTSPFIGEFVQVGKDPSAGETLTQTCSDDPERNGRDALMVVTGLDPAGFFVTDISACRLKEQLALGVPENPEACVAQVCAISKKACTVATDCNRYFPGNFSSMFIYNYNFPDNLDEGDLLFTLSGSIQEFTSTTQMVFPAWGTAERVRRLPPDQWNKWLQYAQPVDLTQVTCGAFNNPTPFITDALCGHNRRNLKMESLESGLVRARRVRFPQRFVSCDNDGNNEVVSFCEDTQAGQWVTCNFDNPSAESQNDRLERTCNSDCTIGQGPHAGVLCSERTNFIGFGQYVVEMQLPGPAAFGLDETLPARIKSATSTAGGSAARITGYAAGNEVALVCDGPVRYRFGGDSVSATTTDASLELGQVLRHAFAPGETSVAFVSPSAAAVTCSTGINPKTRINLITKDAIPELNPDCDENDANAELATQCRNLRGSQFDVVGHLRHVQAARPRWVIIPRSPDDVCCYPGPGLQCPRPIRACQ